MLQELATNSSAQAWVIGSMLFFIGVFALVVIRIVRTPKAVHQARAQLPLEDAEGPGQGAPTAPER